MTSTDTLRIAIIGGGAAGLMAAGAALEMGAEVTVFEHNDRLGKKVRITGKGRCNVTNDCTRDEFLAAVVHNPRFLYAPLSALSPQDTIALFEGLGVPLKTERGRRVFPVSDRAEDIVSALKNYASLATVRHTHVRGILTEEGRAVGVLTDKKEYFDRVILATGGASYSTTGSDGSGFRMVETMGHTVTPLCPSLVPLTSADPCCRDMMGLSLRNVGLTVRLKNGKTVYEDFGELLFTHFGLSGPTVLSASSHLHEDPISQMEAVIDLKPALSEKELDTRILGDFEKYSNRQFSNALGDLLPAKMIPVMVRRSGISPDAKVHTVTREQRKHLVQLFKAFSIPLSGFRPIEEAIITAGGVSVKEISPKTMESKLFPHLYFAGEVIDVDAYTGGYNLQIAFSTGYLAGRSAALSE